MVEKDMRKEITHNWLNAVDYLIKNGILNSYRDLESKTGIQNQRVTLIKSFLRDPEKHRTSYAHIDYLFHLIDQFDVSWVYLFYGEGPIISKKSNDHVVFEEERKEYTKKSEVLSLKKEMQLMMDRIEKLED